MRSGLRRPPSAEFMTCAEPTVPTCPHARQSLPHPPYLTACDAMCCSMAQVSPAGPATGSYYDVRWLRRCSGRAARLTRSTCGPPRAGAFLARHCARWRGACGQNASPGLPRGRCADPSIPQLALAQRADPPAISDRTQRTLRGGASAGPDANRVCPQHGLWPRRRCPAAARPGARRGLHPSASRGAAITALCVPSASAAGARSLATKGSASAVADPSPRPPAGHIRGVPPGPG